MIVLSAIRLGFEFGMSRIGNLLLGPVARAAELVADADARLVWSYQLTRQCAAARKAPVPMPHR